jgi:hypothetical protein
MRKCLFARLQIHSDCDVTCGHERENNLGGLRPVAQGKTNPRARLNALL